MAFMKAIRLFILFVIVCSYISCNRTQSSNSKEAKIKTEIQILVLEPAIGTVDQYKLVLCSKSDTTLKLTMLLGKYEAQTLAIDIKNLRPEAPLPLDLLTEVLKKCNYTVSESYIDGLDGEIFTAKIICKLNNSDKTIELNARPNDAINISIKTNSPIFVKTDFLQ
jgi:uncharacterized protein